MEFYPLLVVCNKLMDRSSVINGVSNVVGNGKARRKQVSKYSLSTQQ